MDLNAIKQKLEGLQTKQQSGTKTDYSAIYWKPTLGKQQIRIVPSAYNPSNPFSELKFYYGITNKVMLSPLNYGEKDPIALFAAKLREEYTKENFVMAKKLDPKTRYFVPVIVRGEEDKGTRLWQFGKLVYEELLALAVDDEIGDYTDIVNGRDLTVETVGPESTGTPYNKSSVRVRLKTSPLSEDASLVEKWTSEQPNPTDGLFKKFTFDEMKVALEKWLSPEVEEEETNLSENAFPTTAAASPSTSNFSLDTSNVKKNKADAFDSMFDSKDGNNDDDLPF